MPKIVRAIPETDTLVTRAVALGIIQEVMSDRMGLPKGVPINFPGFAEGIAQPRTLISNMYEDERFPTNQKISITVSENYVEDWMPAIQTHRPEQIPSFLNRDLEVELRPIYASVELKVSLVYRAENKTQARNFWEFMMTKLPDRQDTWLHTVQYSYGIPEVYMAILKEIHRLTELTEGYGDDFDEFFTKWVNPRYGKITDQVGKNSYGVFSETQARIMGFFDIGTTPDFGAKKDETEAWEIEIPYVIRYDKPKDMYMGYPITIHNTVLSSKYRGTAGMERLEDYDRVSPKSIGNIAAVGNAFGLRRNYAEHPGHYFPLFDEFIPRMVTPNTLRVMTSLITLETNTDADQLLLMNLKDLEEPGFGMVLNECVKQYISDNHQYVTKQRAAAIHVALYMGRLQMDDSFIEMDADLNIRLTKPMSKRKYYHIRVSIVNDLSWLTQRASDELRKNPCMLMNLLEYVMPEGTILPKLDVAGGQVRPINYEDIIDWVRGKNTGRIGMKTVQTTKVAAVYQLNKKR